MSFCIKKTSISAYNCTFEIETQLNFATNIQNVARKQMPMKYFDGNLMYFIAYANISSQQATETNWHEFVQQFCNFSYIFSSTGPKFCAINILPWQTWNLSKNLHHWIFRLKILHRRFYLISTVLVLLKLFLKEKKHKK